MGCKYACTCSGNCLSCSGYPESYFGEAEDIRAQELGFNSYNQYLEYQKMSKEMEAAYYKEMEEAYRKEMEDHSKLTNPEEV